MGEATIDRVIRYLHELALRYHLVDETISVPAGSAAIYITVRRVHDLDVVHLVAPMLEGFDPRSADFKQLLELNSQLRFGKFCFYPESGQVRLECELIGESLDPIELETAVSVLSTVADEYDEILKRQFGGRLPLEPRSDVRSR